MFEFRIGASLIALVVALGATGARAGDEQVPMPAMITLEPLTAADVGVAGQEQTGSIDLNIVVPLPESADLQPLTPADLAPVTAAAPAVEKSGEAAAAASAPTETPKTEQGKAEAAAAPAKDVGVASQPDPAALALATLLAEPSSLGKLQGVLASFYEARGGKPVWIKDGKLSAQADALLKQLGRAGEDGLDPALYVVARSGELATPANQARVELDIWRAAVVYARHLAAGRFNPRAEMGKLAAITPELPEMAAIVRDVAAADDPAKTLAAFAPPHQGYAALKRELAQLRVQRTDVPVEKIDDGAVLRPGKSDERVPALRRRLGLPAGEGTGYEGDLVQAVKAFQADVGLAANGILGSSTVDALNGTKAGDGRKIDMLIANMERWRWLPRDLGDVSVRANIPEFMVRVFRGEQVIHQTRAVVGKPSTPTAIFSASMDQSVINPSWTVPPSMVKNEFMPLLQSNPAEIARRGIEVVRDRRGNVSFRQPPGERNALGRIKFLFPNDQSIYMHDTPSRHLFANKVRAYSHGCVRVNEPTQLGEVLFGIGLAGENWTANRIAASFGGGERWLKFKTAIPVHLTYFTAFIGADGKLETVPDIYGMDARVLAELGLGPQPRNLASDDEPARGNKRVKTAKPQKETPRQEQQAESGWQRFFSAPQTQRFLQ